MTVLFTKMLNIIAGLLVLAVVVVIIIYLTGKESMTKIRRGVGFANDANESPIAAGIIHGAPIMDYTYTYFDGKQMVSCDECPSKYMCGECPQFGGRETFLQMLPSEAYTIENRSQRTINDILYRDIMGLSLNDVVSKIKKDVYVEGGNGYIYKE